MSSSETKALERLLMTARTESARCAGECDKAHAEYVRRRDLANEAVEEYDAINQALARLRLTKGEG